MQRYLLVCLAGAARNNKPILRSSIITLPLFFFALSLSGRTPNIVLIMVDDMGWECLSPYGGEDYQTPNIDRLAKEGVVFDHCFSTPLCTPSRVKLMTGKYNFRNYTYFGYLNPEERTFGHMLQEAGYKTAIVGKWQLNGLYNGLPGHQDSSRPLKAGFDEALLWQVTRGKHSNDGGGERYWNPPLEHNGTFISAEENWGLYGPDLFTDFICDFMQRYRDEPFFVYYPMVLVHDVFVPTPDTLGDQPLETANIQPVDFESRKKHFSAMVTYTDHLLGRILSQLEALGLSEDTLVLFTADNGTDHKIKSNWNGVDVPGGKGGRTDTGNHVPLLAFWKGKSIPGKRVKDLIDFTDFFPTLAEVAGVDLPGDTFLDGQSFLHKILGKPGPQRAWVYNHYQPYWGPTPGRFLRTLTHKLHGDGRFYHLAHDRFEEYDLAAKSMKASTLANYEALQALMAHFPEIVQEKGNNADIPRPVYPDWVLSEE